MAATAGTAPEVAAVAAAFAVDTLKESATVSTSAAAAVSIAAKAPSAEAFEIWRAVSEDAAVLEGGISSSDLASRPLWPGGAPLSMSGAWTATHFRMNDDHWSGRRDWFERRLSGRTLKDDIELAHTSIPQTLWSLPREESAWVAAEIEKLKAAQESEKEVQESPPIEAIPAQVGAAIPVTTDTTQPIGLGADPPGSLDVSDQDILYAEAHEKAETLCALPSNELQSVARPARRCLDAMPDVLADVSMTLLWTRANTLRTTLRAHDDAVELRKKAPRDGDDPAILVGTVAAALRDLVETWNVFVSRDAAGRELDRRRPSPDDRLVIGPALDAANNIVEGLSRGVTFAKSEVHDTLRETIDAIPQSDGTIQQEQAKGVARDSVGNFVVELLRRAYKPIAGETSVAWRGVREGAYRATGAAVAGGSIIYKWPDIVAFVVDNAQSLKQFVAATYQNPALERIIDIIVRTHL